MSDTASDISNSAINLFRIKAEMETNPATRQSLAQTLESFKRFLKDSTLTIEEIDEDIINEWLTWLFANGYTHKTATYYLNRLSALYGKIAKELGIVSDVPFKYLKAKLKDATKESVEINAISDCFSKIRQLVLKDFTQSSSKQLSKDLILFSLYNGGLPFEKIAKFRKDEYNGTDSAILAIIERYNKPRNKYLFPLNQSGQTSAQLIREVSSRFREILHGVGVEITQYNSNLPINLWAKIAIQCGVSASDVSGCINIEAINPLYSFVPRNELTEEQQSYIRTRVVHVLARDQEEWYAMQFRPHIDYERVEKRLKENNIAFSKTFYPMQEIFRRVGKKRKRELKPVVPGLFFFRCKATALPIIFYCIGDLAWGYRYSKSNRNSYAIISQRSLEVYQSAVGEFVDYIDAFPEGILSIEKGDKVEVIGGIYTGHPAIVEKECWDVKKGSETVTHITYKLRLAGAEHYSWTIKVDPRMIAKVSDAKFNSLKESL